MSERPATDPRPLPEQSGWLSDGSRARSLRVCLAEDPRPGLSIILKRALAA